MSDISEIVQSAQGGRAIDNLAQRFGLSGEQTEAAVEALIPALSLGLQKAAAEPATLAPVMEAVLDSRHHASFDDADAALSEAAVERGRAALDHLFGSASTVGQIAQLASRECGVRPDILARLAPTLASIVLGGLFKSFGDQGLVAVLGRLAQPGGSASDLGQTAAAPPVGSAGAGDAEPSRKGLVGLLGSLLGALFGGGPRQSPATEPAGSRAASTPDEQNAASLEAALDQIKKTFQPGVTVGADHRADLKEILKRAVASGAQ